MDTNDKLSLPPLLTKFMTLSALRIARISTGVTVAVAVSYGCVWQLYFITPIFAFIFLGMPVWIGWKMARQLLFRLGYALVIGIVISEFFLSYPLLCIPLYGLLFFFIYYNDTPSAPPMSTLFMTLGITMVPIVSFLGAGAAHFIAFYLLVNMGAGLVIAWVFHTFLPDTLSHESGQATAPKKAPPPALPSDEDRARLALVSTIVAVSAVAIFFALNLAQHALAMVYICFMAGTPNKNASVTVMKANALATCIGGVTIIIVFNFLVAVPTYLFLVFIVLFVALIFSRKILAGGPRVAAFSSGFTTFLVLLGSSTGVEKTATVNFYLRISQVLFAGLFTLVALVVVENVLRSRKSIIQICYAKVCNLLRF